ncbi:MAG: ABC transporter ATP-binding protein [Clostridia bacterium]|nr:ABC transporter ATP-binding protein [Clostridia bacterium]
MIQISKFGGHIARAFESVGVAAGDIEVFCATDLDSSFMRADTLIAVTAEKTYVLEGVVTVSGRPGREVTKEFAIKASHEYDNDKIKDLAVEELVSTAMLTCSFDGEPKIIACMTKNSLRDARIFVKYAAGPIEKKEVKIDDEDFKDERFCPKCGRRYPDPERKICPRCMEKSKFYKRLFEFSKAYKKQMLTVLICLAALSALGVIAPYVSTSFFYDKVLTPESKWYGQLLFVLALVVLLKLASLLVNAVTGIISARVSGKVTYDLKKTIFSSIERLSLSFFTARQTGGLMNQINNDSNTIYWFFCMGVPAFLKNSVQMIAVFVIMFIMDPVLAAFSAVIIPLFAYIVYRIFKKMTSLHAKTYASSRALNSALSDNLAGFRVVKAFSREKEETARFDRASYRLARDSRNVTFFNNTAFPFASFIMFLSNIIVWGVGGWMVITGKSGMTYGTLMAFLAYVALMNEPMYMLVDMVYWFSDCTNAAQRLFEIADAEPDVREREDPVRLTEMKGHVEFKDVEFSYIKGKKVIDGVSFEVDAGRCIGIVGHSGAGKSTIANLLMRLYDTDAGQILIDGVNIKDLSFDELRKNIGIVSQETYLFVGTIAENIRYARSDATFEDVVAAAKIAGAHEFIVKLPDGYDTKIGFGYKDLSGGEKQRISIARAVLLDPKILILDEATAAMDTQTERKIQHALRLLSKGRTTIMIAHRLSTLRDADKLIVLENGKMPESGTHDELIHKKGIYYDLYRLQLEALKNIGVEE